jgi:dipeptidyl aminopeptidase/acylaminoacyl peptidase
MGRTPIQNPVAGKKSVIDISSTSGNPARQRTVGILLATVTGVFALSGVMALAWKFLPPQEETPRPVTITFPQSETAVLFLTVTPPVDGFATIQFLETQVAATQTTPTIPLPPTEDFESTTTARARQTEITAAQITPDIKPVTSLPDAWIAFYSNKNGSRDIFLINALTRELKSLITDSSHDKVPAWSPDGRSLAFESNRGSSDAGIFQIFVYNLDSGQSKKLTNDSACSNYNPAWSPDGQKIVFYSRCTDNKNRQILVMDRDGTNKRQLTSSGESWFPAWSPDGSFLAFTSYQNGPIYIMDNNGQNVHFLSDGCSTNFSPDGQWIVFSSTCDDSQILLIHPDGSGKKAIGSLAGQNPSFSPDGQWIAFQSNNDIWVMRLDGSSLEQLTSDHPSSGGVPVWQP